MVELDGNGRGGRGSGMRRSRVEVGRGCGGEDGGAALDVREGGARRPVRRSSGSRRPVREQARVQGKVRRGRGLVAARPGKEQRWEREEGEARSW